MVAPKHGRPELVIGLVAPIGTALSLIEDELSVVLSEVGYTTRKIRISRCLHDIDEFADLATCEKKCDYYEKHMDAGDELRSKLDRNDAMACLAIAAIREARLEIIEKAREKEIKVPSPHPQNHGWVNGYEQGYEKGVARGTEKRTGRTYVPEGVVDEDDVDIDVEELQKFDVGYRRGFLDGFSEGYKDPVQIFNHAFILHSLKTPEEILTLRRIYGSRFLVISAYAPRTVRVRDLARKLADSEQDLQINQHLPDAQKLIVRDEFDTDDPYGQNVSKAFPKADIFAAADDPNRLKADIKRSMELLFGNTFHTPTRDEYGMYLAEAAALRSSALGRQVGAVITTNDGDVVAVGSNEVPKVGGGLYWTGDEPDRRDFALGYDSNDSMKRKVLGDVLKRLKRASWLSADKDRLALKDLVELALGNGEDGPLKGATIQNIIEFGRCVHAEMAAIVRCCSTRSIGQ